MNEYKQTVLNYFKDKAEDYDLVDNQEYWVLSDKLLWEILNKHVLSELKEDFTFLDAGGGTGRWTIKILENYINSTGELVDLSNDMLSQAKNKINNKKLDARIKLVQADLDKIENYESNKFDISFTFHNVLGFVKNPKLVLEKMTKMTKIGGYVVALVPNYYHSIYFNLNNNNLELAEKAFKNYRGKFTEDMPDMNLFSPSSLSCVYEELELEITGMYGFPTIIYPGYQETQLHGESKNLKNLLKESKTFKKVFEMEMNLYKNEDAISRGNQIIIIGKKVESQL